MYDKSDPIVIFLIQATIVIVFCRMLHIGLARLRQPRVIAEVIGGILLGPSAFGRIKNFTPTIFPAASLPQFNLVANVGLILFLFIVGLEVDLRLIRKNARVALSVGAASLALPFAFGCLMAWAINKAYNEDKKDNFGTFLLFIGTAFSITAFPVLARILTELKLLRLDVGVTVLAAGVGNDVVGWILLALTIALVNSSTGLTAFYVILLVVGWVLLLCFGIRPVYVWLAKKTGMESGPTDLMMVITILIVMVSAFYTDIIGVHPIFGAFLVGLIVPHEHGFAVRITEKIEDLVSVLFLPLYFASSGLKTNIGLLNDGKVWGYTIAIIVCATVSKIVGAMLAARINGFFWRESMTIGTLMSCKGLVELIVLNVGLSAGILSQKVFTMFVVMALVTTFMTTPLVRWIYPPRYQEKVTRFRAGECEWDNNRQEMESIAVDDALTSGQAGRYVRIMLSISRTEDISALLTFTHSISTAHARLYLSRIIEITDRLSQIIQVSEFEDLLQKDSLIAIFKTLAKILGFKMNYGLHVSATSEYAEAIETDVADQMIDLTVIPWSQIGDRDTLDNEYINSLLDRQRIDLAVILEYNEATMSRPSLRQRTMSMGSTSSRSQLRSRAQDSSPTSSKPQSSGSNVDTGRTHIYFPMYQFGPDERLALLLLAQMLVNPNMTYTLIFFQCAPYKDALESKSSKVQFLTTETHVLSRSTTAMSHIFEPDPSAIAAQDAQIAELKAFLASQSYLSSISVEIVNTPCPLTASLDEYCSLAKQHSTSTLSTLLSRTTNLLTQQQIRFVNRQILNDHYIPGSRRGYVVEIFAAMNERKGTIIMIQAKKDSIE